MKFVQIFKFFIWVIMTIARKKDSYMIEGVFFR